MSRASRRLAGVFVAGVVLSLASASSPGFARGVPSEVGTVETIAGPGFCRTSATLDSASAEVRALALSGGLLHVDTGPLGEGLFAVVDTRGVRPGGTTDPRRLVRLEVLGPDGSAAPGDEAEGSEVASAGRLAPDAGVGTLVLRGQTIFKVALTPVAAGPGDRRVPDEVAAGDPEAGAGTPSGGDGGPAPAATFRRVRAIATDQVGNLYVADEVDEAGRLSVRVVNRTDTALTFYPGTSMELTVAPKAIGTVLQEAPGLPVPGSLVALAATGERLYLAVSGPSDAPGEEPEARVHLVNLGGQPLVAHGGTVAPGAVEVVAGVDSPAPSDGPAPDLALGLGRVPAMAADPGGSLYLVDETHHRVVELSPAGAETTVAGTGGAGFNGNERPAAEALLDSPSDLELSPEEQRLYLADRGNGQLRFIDQAGFIHAGLGNGAGLTWRCQDGGVAPRPELDNSAAGLSHLVADSRGGVYLSLTTYNQVQRLDPSVALEPVIGVRPAGRVCGADPACSPIGDGGPVGEALVNAGASATRPGGGLYVVDTGRGVRLANLGPDPLVAHGRTVAPGTIETVVAGEDGSVGDMAALALSFSVEVAADATGNLYIADPGDEDEGVEPGLYVLGPDGAVTTLAKSAADPKTSCCASPRELTIDGDGDLYVVDDRVWFFNRGRADVTVHSQIVAPGEMAPVTGAEGDLVAGEGRPAQEVGVGAEFAAAADAQGNLYLGSGNEVRRIDPAGILTTVVGTGADGFNGDGLFGRLTTLYGVSALAVDRCGNLLIADTQNQRVRRWNAFGPCAAPSVPAGDTDGGLSGSSQRLLVAGGALLGTGLVALVWWFRRRIRPT